MRHVWLKGIFMTNGQQTEQSKEVKKHAKDSIIQPNSPHK